MNDVIELAQQLIRTPSPVYDGDETLVAALVQDWLADAGLPAAEVYALAPDRPNLVATIDFGTGGSHLVLSGHLDTKPVGAAKWTVDPFGADIDGDRLYGLGSGDMKAAIAAMLVATRDVVDAGALTAGRLTLLLTADEEDGSTYGAKYLSSGALDLSADALVIGEPGGIEDDFDGLHLVSRGLGRFTLTATAVQGHSSLSTILPRRNAGLDLADALQSLAGVVEVTVPDNTDDLRHWGATVNPALTFRGGVGYGVLPQEMTATVEVRTIPGMTDEQLLADLRAAVAPRAAATGADVAVEFDNAPHHWIEGTRVRAADPLVASIQRVTENVFGASLPLTVFPGTTDTSWFAPNGIPSLPALGPGLISRAHGADEWVSVDAVRRSVDLYRALITDFCASSREDRP
ncbi:M20 family metallopeptidase [Herbiconiux sp. L3-i23]|uniref:M20 family metallopeptidase n=1 Tax=Herbiconiux sp. L3-i23 TaxID=2905871 RepID=UPI00205A5EAA|nr:M20 family metallopeptidase [Herbiconiux sp. L3-i23]BDI22602.1 succinyl-diaminopimelate desuccinylase [Herbiconiux sp. L3-i23]